MEFGVPFVAARGARKMGRWEIERGLLPKGIERVKENARNRNENAKPEAADE